MGEQDRSEGGIEVTLLFSWVGVLRRGLREGGFTARVFEKESLEIGAGFDGVWAMAWRC